MHKGQILIKYDLVKILYNLQYQIWDLFTVLVYIYLPSG